MGKIWPTNARELTRPAMAPAKPLPRALENALKLTDITPMEANQVRASIKRPETNARILRMTVATFFRP